MIDLRKRYHVKRIVIENVKNPGYQANANGLRVYLSNYAMPRSGMQVFQAGTVGRKLEIPLVKPLQAQYITIGVENNYLHLAHAWVYGY